MTSNCGIYSITNTLNGDSYIGSAVNLRQRWFNHRSRLVSNIHENEHLQRAWKKYSEDNFIFETVELCDKERLIEREQIYIDSEKPVYNMCPVAGSCLGVKRSDETKRKVSEAKKGNTNMLGKHLSEEARCKVSEALKGNTYFLGHNHTDETRRKMSETKKGELNPNFGKPISEEQKRKLSEAGKRYWAEKKRGAEVSN